MVLGMRTLVVVLVELEANATTNWWNLNFVMIPGDELEIGNEVGTSIWSR